jgi:hypothetical protein
LIPLDFVRVSAAKVQADWAPFTFTSGVALGARALVYAALFAGLVASVLRWRQGRRLAALMPLALAVGGLLALDVAAHVVNAFPGATGTVQTEARRLLLGMSWLPAVAVGCAVWAVVRARRGRAAPLSGSWPVDLALIAAALVLAVRAYNEFTTNTYAAYYAPPLVLLAAILHERVARRFPAARLAVLASLTAIVASLACNALMIGPAADETFEVRTARGGYLALPETGTAYQRVLDLVRQRTRPGEPLLALPLEGGLPFAADRPPALRELQFHPGILDSRADERDAISQVSRRGVRLVIQGNTRFDAWGLPVMGVDYNRLLINHLRSRSRVVELGSYDDEGDEATAALVVGARAFRVYERR